MYRTIEIGSHSLVQQGEMYQLFPFCGRKHDLHAPFWLALRRLIYSEGVSSTIAEARICVWAGLKGDSHKKIPPGMWKN